MKITIYVPNNISEKVSGFCERTGFKKSGVYARGAEKLIDEFPKLYAGEVGELYQVKAVNIPKVKETNPALCKHGSQKGLCKWGC